MTLLTICQDAADELQLGARPVAVIGNTATDAQTLLRFARRVCRDLATRAPWQAMRMRRAFVATATQEQTGVLPASFQRFIPETMWDLTNGNFIPGPIGPVEWQSLTNSASTANLSPPVRVFTQRGNAVLMFPIPAGNENFAFEYQSGNFCQSAGGTPQNDWLADTDTARISEELITLGVVARFLEANGMPWQSAKADYERRLNVEIRNDAPTERVMSAGDIFGGSRHFQGAPGDRFDIYGDSNWGGWYDTWGGP
jgi:hypothetical protein